MWISNVDYCARSKNHMVNRYLITYWTIDVTHGARRRHVCRPVLLLLHHDRPG